MSWTRTGTVSVTNNSNAVIGTGTGFLSSSRVGDAFIGPDGASYEVGNIGSDTAMSIIPNYKGPTLATEAYAIAPMQGYNKDSADALRAASLQVGVALDGLNQTVQAAAASASAAQVSKSVASQSETNAGQSAAAAQSSKDAAGTSEANAAQSAVNALASQNAAGTSETNAVNSAAAALVSKNAAAISEQNTANKAARGANSDITSLSGLTTALSVAQGGTGVVTVGALVTSLQAAGMYGKTNAVGTVGQTSGVPAGALMEAGSNANGTYEKYACGTLICKLSQSLSISLSSLYGPAGYNSTGWVFPMAFVAGTVPYCNLIAALPPRITNCSPTVSITNAAASFFMWDLNGAVSGTYALQWFAIGRWF